MTGLRGGRIARIRRRQIIATLAAACMVAVVVFAHPSRVYVYDGRNAGAVVDVAGHCVGVEWRGVPGVFTGCG